MQIFAVMNGLLQWIAITALIVIGDGAIEPPPWSDPTRNPCANKPGGWQLLYWAPLKQCFKIYTVIIDNARPAIVILMTIFYL